MIKTLFVPLLAAACVSAHGFLATVTINGKSYTGNGPSGNDDPSIIRQVSSQDPNHGASNPALTCGPDATKASLVADANPGDTFTFDWRTASLGNWPHNTGPMLTYLASCGSQTCDEFDAGNAKWFKIQQVGRKNPGGPWAQQDLMNGDVATVTLPQNLAPGNYLIRHEIIALHLATTRGLAEFYPACTQIRVGGSQTGAPSGDELVSLPGAYSDDDPGIFDPDVFNTNADYVFPGPAIAGFVTDGSSSPSSGTSTSSSGSSTPTSGGGSQGGSSSSSKISSTRTAGAPTPTATRASSPSQTCKLKKTAPQNDIVRPRHLSRVMRRLAFDWSH